MRSAHHRHGQWPDGAARHRNTVSSGGRIISRHGGARRGKSKKHECPLYIFDYAPHGPRLHLSEPTYLYPELDVTVWRLPQDVVAAMPNRKFLTVHHTDRDNRRPRKGIYMIHGYPKCWYELDAEQNNLTFQPFTAVCGEYRGDTKDLHKDSPYDPDFHILLETRRDGAFPVIGPDATTPDQFHGLSGCSIWQVLYEGLDPRLWTPERCGGRGRADRRLQRHDHQGNPLVGGR